MRRLLTVVLFLILLSSCGVISRSRYGNGLKWNSELKLFGKGGDQVDSAYIKKYITNPKKYKVSSRRQPQNSTALPRQESPAKQSSGKGSTPPDNTQAPQRKAKNPGELETNKRESEVPGPPQQVKTDIDTTLQPLEVQKPPIEPNVELGAIFFFGGGVANMALAVVASLVPGVAILALLTTFLPLVGFILAIVGLVNIRDAKREGFIYRGKGLAIAIISLFGVGVLLFFLYLLILLLLVLALL